MFNNTLGVCREFARDDAHKVRAVFDVQWCWTDDVADFGLAGEGVCVAGGVDGGEAVDHRFAQGGEGGRSSVLGDVDVALDDTAVEVGGSTHVLHGGLGEVHRHSHVLGGFAGRGVGNVVVDHGYRWIDDGDGVGYGFFKCGAGVYECHDLDPLVGNIIAAAKEAQTACAFCRSNEDLGRAFFVEAALN